jgi:hypothetical protein
MLAASLSAFSALYLRKRLRNLQVSGGITVSLPQPACFARQLLIFPDSRELMILFAVIPAISEVPDY